MNSEYNPQSGSRVLLGTIIILIGGLYLLKTLDFISFNISHVIFSFPFILFIVGVIILINSRNRVFGLILALVGGLFLIPRLYPNIELNNDIIWPILIIIFGVHLIFRKRIHTDHKYKHDWKTGDYTNYVDDADAIDDVAIFGGGHKTIISENFKGGNITAVFGGSEIDLTQCKLAEGDVIIEAVMIFGGTTIMVPREWNVRVNITPIFGGFSNKVLRNPINPIDTTRTLIIKGVAVFGGGEIKYF